MWKLKCLLCDCQNLDLVKMQEHGMDMHNITREDLRDAARTTLGIQHYKWSLPDGRDWMEAHRMKLHEYRLTDAKGRLCLGKEYINKYVQVDDSDPKRIVVTPLVIIPDPWLPGQPDGLHQTSS